MAEGNSVPESETGKISKPALGEEVPSILDTPDDYNLPKRETPLKTPRKAEIPYKVEPGQLQVKPALSTPLPEESAIKSNQAPVLSRRAFMGAGAVAVTTAIAAVAASNPERRKGAWDSLKNFLSRLTKGNNTAAELSKKPIEELENRDIADKISKNKTYYQPNPLSPSGKY